MDIALKQADIIMGNFYNMLIVNNFCAIHYDFQTNGRSHHVMEFVEFADYGNGTYDTRVVEGWGSTKDSTYYGTINFQGSEEKKEQEELNNLLLTYQLPTDHDDDLQKKYLIKYDFNNSDSDADAIFNIILNGFDSWNNGYSTYQTWVNGKFDQNATSFSMKEEYRNLTTYLEEIEELFKNEEITKLYFDNVLIREKWAAIHYRYRRFDKKNFKVSVGDRMEFFQFKEDGSGNLKIIWNWIQ